MPLLSKGVSTIRSTGSPKNPVSPSNSRLRTSAVLTANRSARTSAITSERSRRRTRRGVPPSGMTASGLGECGGASTIACRGTTFDGVLIDVCMNCPWPLPVMSPPPRDEPHRDHETRPRAPVRMLDSLRAVVQTDASDFADAVGQEPAGTANPGARSIIHVDQAKWRIYLAIYTNPCTDRLPPDAATPNSLGVRRVASQRRMGGWAKNYLTIHRVHPID